MLSQGACYARTTKTSQQCKLTDTLGDTIIILFFFFSSRRRHTRSDRDWSSDVCSSDLLGNAGTLGGLPPLRGRKERATAGQYAPDPLGHTRAAMAGTMGSDPERGR